MKSQNMSGSLRCVFGFLFCVWMKLEGRSKKRTYAHTHPYMVSVRAGQDGADRRYGKIIKKNVTARLKKKKKTPRRKKAAVDIMDQAKHIHTTRVRSNWCM